MHTTESNRHTTRRIRAGAAVLGTALLTAGVTSTAAQAEKPDKVNLRNGAVYSMSNSPEGNEIAAFSRSKDGKLARVGTFPTGGTGSGSFEDSANGLVLGSAKGETSPNNLRSDSKLLFATNAGSDTITTFRVGKKGLTRADVVDSGPTDKPVSVTVSRGILYVLNSGEQTDAFNALVPGNCADTVPTITGFRVSRSGNLTQIPGSTRELSGRNPSGCAQVSFNPRGDVLVVTERLADDEVPGAPLGDEGSITTYQVKKDGSLGAPQFNEPTGQGPFGFTFTKKGDLLTTEQFDGPNGPGQGAAASYGVNRDGSLNRQSGSVNNGGTDSCWIVATDNGRHAFVASFFGDGQISSYDITKGGGLKLNQAQADGGTADLGSSDLTLSRNSKYLYSLNSFQGKVNVYRVSKSGGLQRIQQVQAQDPSPVTAGVLGLAGI